MPEWDGPPTMLPAFEGLDRNGTLFRTSGRRQFHHMVVAFAERNDPLLDALLARYQDIMANNGNMVVVHPPGANLLIPAHVPAVSDETGRIASMYRPLVADWRPPSVFVADRYGEIMAVTDATDSRLADHVVGWLFSAEVQCSL